MITDGIELLPAHDVRGLVSDGACPDCGEPTLRVVMGDRSIEIADARPPRNGRGDLAVLRYEDGRWAARHVRNGGEPPAAHEQPRMRHAHTCRATSPRVARLALSVASTAPEQTPSASVRPTIVPVPRYGREPRRRGRRA